MTKLSKNVVKYGTILALIIVPLILQGNEALFSDAGSSQKTYDWKWNDASLVSIFEHISVAAGVDIVMDPKISGSLSAKLRGKSWEDAFKVVCHMKDLHYEKKNEYIYVMNNSDYASAQLSAANLQTQLESSMPLERYIIQLKNTDIKDMQNPVKSLMSSRGKVTPVPHTNSLIIEELPAKMPDLQARIAELDREVLQISISAKLVEVASGTSNDMGIQWSFFDKSAGWEVKHAPKAGGWGLEQMSYGLLSPRGFAITLDFLFTEKHSEVVAEPQITTMENKEATIYMGSQIPISHIDFAGNVSITSLDARSELTVTPTVTGNGEIKMQLAPVKKSYELTAEGPVINEQGAKTNVVVRDGETIVIAGMTTDDNQESEGGIPFLKDIPILGYLFKSHSKSISKRDLIIFVTPHIIKSSGLEVLKREDIKKKQSVSTNGVTPQDVNLKPAEGNFSVEPNLVK